MTDQIIDDFLFHFGVKGMKWGVRRDSSGGVQLGAAPRRAHARRVAAVKKATTRRPSSEDHKQLAATKKTSRAKHLSDAEIKKAIGRMNLEKQYNQLNPNKIGKGYKLAIAALAVGTTLNSAYAFSKSPAGEAVIAGVKKAISSTG